MNAKVEMLPLLLVSLFLFAGTVRAEVEVKTDSATGRWLILENGTPVVQYNYQTVPLPEGFLERLTDGKQYAVPRSNYIHPLFDLNGKPITHDWAIDHAHHRGIYWAFPEVGYKGEWGDLHALQKVFARPNGKIETIKNDGNVSLRAENIWKWEDKEPIVHETATITVYPLTNGGRNIDLAFQFKGLADEVTLARREQTLYGGLNIRMARLEGFQSGLFRELDGDAAKNGAAWVFGTWKDAATGKQMELTVFEKADNPDYPGEYIHYPDIQWFQPTFPASGTRFLLKKGETLTLRYRLWIHETTDNAAKKAEWKKYQFDR
jgi:hypothetical protein